MKLIWQLLRQHVSVLQLAGFLVTNLVGVAIVLTAVQLYRDVTPALQAPDSFLDNDFIILTKEVEGAGIGKTSFTQTELAELAEQPFTEALGEFTPARYSVMGGISLAGIGMRTYLFFESVPDRFLDVRSDEWGFEEGSEFVPIILPRNYLNLYNFGFASTRGLPQVSEDLVRGITLDLDLSGRGQFRNLKGRVVAFSNRLNTILVPEEFIRWSNRRFADKPAADPSRIILEVRNAADDRIHEYLALHRYQIEGGAGELLSAHGDGSGGRRGAVDYRTLLLHSVVEYFPDAAKEPEEARRPVDARLYACAGGTALSVAGAGAEPVGAGVRRAGGRLGAVEIPPDGTNAR